MDLTHKNIHHLIYLENNEARLKDSTAFINLKIYNYFNTDLLMRCPACLHIPRYPLNFFAVIYNVTIVIDITSKCVHAVEGGFS